VCSRSNASIRGAARTWGVKNRGAESPKAAGRRVFGSGPKNDRCDAKTRLRSRKETASVRDDRGKLFGGSFGPRGPKKPPWGHRRSREGSQSGISECKDFLSVFVRGRIGNGQKNPTKKRGVLVVNGGGGRGAES